MNLIDIDRLNERLPTIKASYQAKKPFRYVMFENFFSLTVAEQIHDHYPQIKNGRWDGTTYIDQKNKFQKTTFEQGSVMKQLFEELNSVAFMDWLQNLSEIESPLIGDEDLFGGGLHQSIHGAFLNVHVDYNINPKTQLHRRLNVLIYMNKDWKEHYEGHLELWDLSQGKKKLLERIAPDFNRCVIFETNEVSFHGHPKPLKTPDGINRKSIATYYYSKDRPAHEIQKEHNTIYVNTEGLGGTFKRMGSGIKALFERLSK